MRVLGYQLNWGQAKDAVATGHFVRHAHWCANKPIPQPDYVGPTAAGAAEDGKMAVYTDDGTKIHAWEPGADELASSDWQVVDLERKPGEPRLVVPATEMPAPPRAKRRRKA